MKILYVVPRFPAASETFIAEEVIGVRARGHTVTVAALAKPTAGQLAKMGPRLKELADEVVYLPRVPLSSSFLTAVAQKEVRALNRRLSQEASGKTRASLRLMRSVAVATLARRVGAELLYAHWPRPTEVALLAGEIASLPVAISIHAHEVAHDNGHFRAAFERARFAAFCNAAAMDYLLGRLPANASSMAHLVYHGVDFAQFSETPLPPLTGTLHVVTAGRLTPTKGIDRLIRAIGLARDLDVAIILTVIGDGGQRAELEALTTSLDLTKRVRFTGWVPHEEMHDWLSSAHVFALLADDTFHDGLPNVVLESMAIGRPVLISPIPAAAEAIVHGESGYVFGRVDALEEFVECCQGLIANSNRLVLWSRSAAEIVRIRHDKGRQIDKLCKLFSQSALARD